jgi:aminoglycoside 3-N-acetyltransferase
VIQPREVVPLQALIRPAKKWLREPYRKLRTKYIKWQHGFSAAELYAALTQAGIRTGDAILVHSSMDGFAGFEGTVSNIIDVFQAAVGPEGTLLMPTISNSRSAVEFARSNRIFDPLRTPSQVGLLSEIFRRSPGVLRSIHPTHSVAAWGANAGSWIKDHFQAETPCGRGSPFYHLLKNDGKVVLAGTGIGTMTFFHCAEELLEPQMPFSPFTEERYVLTCRVDGELLKTPPMRLYAPEVSRRRCMDPLERELRRKGRWRETRVGTLKVIALSAPEVWHTLEDMSRGGVFCYESS